MSDEQEQPQEGEGRNDGDCWTTGLKLLTVMIAIVIEVTKAVFT